MSSSLSSSSSSNLSSSSSSSSSSSLALPLTPLHTPKSVWNKEVLQKIRQENVVTPLQLTSPVPKVSKLTTTVTACSSMVLANTAQSLVGGMPITNVPQVTPTPDAKKLPEKKALSLEENSNSNGLLKLATILSTERGAQGFLKEAPSLCVEVIDLLAEFAQKIPIETAKKVATIFIKNHVGAAFPENVSCICKDGKVTFNRSLLCLSNDYFRSMFGEHGHTEFSLKLHEAHNNEIIFKEHSKEALECFKSHLMSNKFPEHISIEALTDLAKLAHMQDDQLLVDKCSAQITANAKKKALEGRYAQLQAFPTLSQLLQPKDDQIFPILQQQGHEILKNKDGGFLLRMTSLSLLSEEGPIEAFVRKQFCGLVIDQPKDIDQLLMIDYLLPDCNKVTELRFQGVDVKIDELLKIAKFFPKIEEITLPFIGTHTDTHRRKDKSFVHYFTTTELASLLWRVAAEKIPLKRLHFLPPSFDTEAGKKWLEKASPAGTSWSVKTFQMSSHQLALQLSRSFIDQMKATKLSLFFGDKLRFYMDPKDRCDYSDYSTSNEVNSALAGIPALKENYVAKEVITAPTRIPNILYLFQFEKKQ